MMRFSKATVRSTLLVAWLLALLPTVAGRGLGGERSYAAPLLGSAGPAGCECSGLDDCFNNCEAFNGKDCRITVPPDRLGNPCRG